MKRLIEDSSIFNELSEYLRKIASIEDSYLVGGFLRDLVIGRKLKRELDIVIPIELDLFVRAFADEIGGSYFPLEKENGVFCVVKQTEKGPWRFDFSRMRGKEIVEDLHCRDFTINALAVNVNDIIIDPERLDIIDPLGGIRDIESKRIKVISERSFIDDPLRLIRGVRFSALLGFDISDDTLELIRRNSVLLNRVSFERIRDELVLIFSAPNSSRYIEMLDDLSLLGQVIPEIMRLKDQIIVSGEDLKLWDHSIKTLRFAEKILDNLVWPFDIATDEISGHMSRELEYGVPRQIALKFSSLLHDIGKPDTFSTGEDGAVHFIGHQSLGAKMNMEITQRLRFGTEAQRYIERLTENHLRPLLLAREQIVTHRAVYRFFRDTREDGLSILIMALADAESKEHVTEGIPAIDKVKETIARMLSIYLSIAEKDKDRPFITGHDLINLFGLKPGPIFKEILADLREKQILGILKNREDAIGYLKRQM